MSQEKQTAEEIREDIIDRTYHNINNEPDKSAIHIRIALNNYAVPFEKKLQEQAKEIERLKGENELISFLEWRDKQNILTLHDYNNEELIKLYQNSTK